MRHGFAGRDAIVAFADRLAEQGGKAVDRRAGLGAKDQQLVELVLMIGLELIEYGDPDGGGDLKRNNQIAFRAEVVYGWGIAELNRNFAKLVDKV